MQDKFVLNWHNRQNSSARSVALGTFDGVHRGHQGLLQATLDLCPPNGTSCALTFDVPPEQFFRGEWALIMAFEQKIQAIHNFGIQEVAWLAFNEQIASLSAEDFVDLILVGELRTREVVCGFNHRFGRGRGGDIDFLRKKGKQHGFDVTVVSPIHGDREEIISSTRIRNLISHGKIGEAADFLGSYPTYVGQVVKGAGRGKKLGFPTANLEIDPRVVIPGEGVYLTWCILPNGKGVPAVTSIGKNPTFAGQVQTMEAFILDFNGDLYNQSLEIQFLARLREIVRYNSALELQTEIKRDVALARELLTQFRLQDNKIVLV